ncbi:Membrane dipeptidase (Peptidase family M19) [Planctomycetes bacterium Pan216]|uniref:Membrane dipeptidase (Peptidase family M19) n=1 Tax=Kolteria novifilia TaxID=2527975 RepID=A0A518B5F3_9BACT|nr:Membrane dipeptidase (Peptidase family M19) [Planctomycetes bacterium Pan216]
MVPMIDAHLDLAWNSIYFDRDLTLEVEEIRQREQGMADHPSRGRVTTSLAALRRAGIGVAIVTLLARGGPSFRRASEGFRRTDLDYASPTSAYAVAKGQLAYYRLLEEQGHLRILLTASDLEEHWRRWNENPSTPLGAIISTEGTDPIVTPDQAQAWWEDGLRAAGLAHYGPSQHAFGTGCSGPLTEAGRALLKEMDLLGMLFDVTHLCDESFWEALDLFGGSVLASHHNCRALVPGDRQLADDQIKAIVQRDGVIGAPFDAWMMSPGWIIGETSPEAVSIEAAVDHLDHICQLAGSARHVAIGSDLDGGFGTEQTPHELDTIADLQQLEGILSRRGYSAEDIAAIFHGNWLRLLGRSLPA